jgi:dihydrodipicolinate synthase/N-acetylneuraminate lyase
MSDYPQPPPPGIYVPAVLFFKENEDIDEEATKSHVLHLAQVHTLDFLLHCHILALKPALNS